MSFALSTLSLSSRTSRRVAPTVTTDQTRSVAPAQHFAALDGIRGIAILMVLALHSMGLLRPNRWELKVMRLVEPCYLGVTLFFVLSGFLITRILVQTRENRDYFQTFYLRRALRIFPLYYTYISFILLAYYPLCRWWTGSSTSADRNPLALLFYASNFGWRSSQSPLVGQMWSLAIEEQFYLIWPFVVCFAPRRWLLSICGLGCLASLACRAGMVVAKCPGDLVYSLTPARMDALLLGAAVGLIEVDASARQRLIRWLPTLLGGSVLILVPYWYWNRFRMSSWLTLTLGWSFVTCFFGLVVFWAATTGASNRLLNARWLRGLGKYSYGIYVLHPVPLYVLPRLMQPATKFQRILLVAACVTTTALAVAGSWHFIERPFLRKKDRLAYAKNP